MKKEGKRLEMACNHCQAWRECEYQYRDYKTKEGLSVAGVLCATCLTCGGIAGVHSQSLYRIAVNQPQPRKRTSVTLPVELEDVIGAELSRFGASWSHAELYFRALLVACTERTDEVSELVKLVRDERLSLPNKNRLPFTSGHKLAATLDAISARSGIRNTSEVIRRLIVLSESELKSEMEFSLKTLALAYS